MFYSKYGKRIFDMVLTIPGLVALSPFLVFLALMVRVKLGSPVLFKQIRPGLHGKPFAIYKFRTMTDARNADGQLLPDAERLTRLGRFLRATSLNELPELFNILKGDMSIVGPRPLLMQYLDRYTPEQAGRHEVKPGLTGWAQVNGRNDISWSSFPVNVDFGVDMLKISDFSLLPIPIISTISKRPCKRRFFRQGMDLKAKIVMTMSVRLVIL